MVQVVVIGQNYSTTLSLIRSLGEAGYICNVVRCGPGTPDKLTRRFSKPDVFSRYVKKSISVSRKTKQHVINRIIEEFGNLEQKKVVLPADDYSATLLSEFAQTMSPYFFFPDIREREYRLDYVMNKSVQKKMAASFDISVADNWEIQIKLNQEPIIPADVTYPCVTKPLQSVGLPKSYIQCCYSQDQLKTLLLRISKECSCSILVEQYVDVECEYTIPGISDGENVLIPAFIKKMLISEGEHKGVTIKGVVEDACNYDGVRKKLMQLIVSTGFVGIFDIELFYSRGCYYLNEINFRNGAAGYALTYAGVNLPAMWVDAIVRDDRLTKQCNPLKATTFVSDKAAFEYMLAGYCSYKEYRRICKSVDALLIGNTKDWQSVFAFTFLKSVLLVKAIVKWIIKRN